MNYNDKDFLEKVQEKSEAMQCLHYAAICNFSKTLPLIGNRLSCILKGMWIHYSNNIKLAHTSTLKICYNLS